MDDRYPYDDLRYDDGTVVIDCPSCGGSGGGADIGTYCRRCGGRGAIVVPATEAREDEDG